MPAPPAAAPLRAVRGVEVGNIFKLGTRYSVAMGATYLDENGESKPIVMGSYGIGSERLMACIVERFNDDKGIIWPISVAPYQIALVSLATEKQPEVAEAADRIYAELKAAGFEVLYDDRDERAGVKFNDADLLGMPSAPDGGRQGVAKRHRRVEDTAARARCGPSRSTACSRACAPPPPKSGPGSTPCSRPKR